MASGQKSSDVLDAVGDLRDEQMPASYVVFVGHGRASFLPWAVGAVISEIVSFEEMNNSKFWGILSRKLFGLRKYV